MTSGYRINAEDLIVLRLEFYSYSMGILDNKENEEYIWDRNRMEDTLCLLIYYLSKHGHVRRWVFLLLAAHIEREFD